MWQDNGDLNHWFGQNKETQFLSPPNHIQVHSNSNYPKHVTAGAHRFRIITPDPLICCSIVQVRNRRPRIASSVWSRLIMQPCLLKSVYNRTIIAQCKAIKIWAAAASRMTRIAAAATNVNLADLWRPKLWLPRHPSFAASEEELQK